MLTQPDPGGLEKYRQATLSGMGSFKATVLEEMNTSVDGIDSYRVVYKANMAGKDLKFCSTAVPKNSKIRLRRPGAPVRPDDLQSEGHVACADFSSACSCSLRPRGPSRLTSHPRHRLTVKNGQTIEGDVAVEGQRWRATADGLPYRFVRFQSDKVIRTDQLPQENQLVEF